MTSMKKFFGTFLLAGVLFQPVTGLASTFAIDPDHSTVLFRIQHIAGYTAGTFSHITGSFQLNDANNLLTGVASEIETVSVNTQQTQRDEDLRGGDFFDALKFPTAKFIAKKIENGKIDGELTLKGITKPVTLAYKLGDISKDSAGKTTIALAAQGTVRCKDFGITSTRVLEKGKPLLGDEVEVGAQLTGILQ